MHVKQLDAAAGAIAGLCDAVVTCPLDVIKTRQQVSRVPLSTTEAARQLLSSGGLRGLWRGVTPLAFGRVPEKAVSFMAFEQAKLALAAGPGTSAALHHTIIAGICAGIAEAVFVVTPMELFKVRLQTCTDSTSLSGQIHAIIRDEGPLALYRGLLPTLLRQTSNQATRFAVYGASLDALRGDGPAAAPQIVVAGMAAGAASVAVNNGVDVVKTRVQSQPHVHHSSWRCAVSIAQREGVRGFYKGAGIRLARVVPGQAITFLAFERCRASLRQLFDG
jgi:solute carrier family 25 citrate transporter 1